MRLKTYSAASMSEALNQIRKDLGADAIIVSSEEAGKTFRVTAAVETAEISLQAPLFQSQRRKNCSLLQLMEIFCRCLEYHVVPSKISDMLLGRLRTLLQDSPMQAHDIGAIVSQLIPCHPLAFNNPSILLIQGPSGAGKSMTTAKLASEYILAGHVPYIVTTDTLKAGAVEQLRTYANALKAPFESFAHHRDLLNFLMAKNPLHPVIIDTPGINPLNAGDLETLQELSVMVRLSPILVCPAGMDTYELLDRLDAYGKLRAERLILTRGDATTRFGTLLTAVLQGSLTLSHIGMGPELGSRLRPACGDLVLNLLTSPLEASQSQNQPDQSLWKEAVQ